MVRAARCNSPVVADAKYKNVPSVAIAETGETTWRSRREKSLGLHPVACPVERSMAAR